MKPLKGLGLVTVVALLMTALGGAPSAMAQETTGTDLCLEDESPCESEEFVTHVHESTTEAKKAILLSGLGNVECNVLFLGEVLEEATEGPIYVYGSFTYTSCLREGSACEVKEVSEGSSFSILKDEEKEAEEEASVTDEEGKLNVHCGLSINCTYSLEGLLGTVNGSLLATLKNGELSISGQAFKETTGALCPETSKLDITMTPLVETFISQANMYCVRYENSRGRWLLGPNSTTCQGNHGVRENFNYEFIWSRNPNLTFGSMLCVRDDDLFYAVRNGTLCENKFPVEPEGNFELGKVA